MKADWTLEMQQADVARQLANPPGLRFVSPCHMVDLEPVAVENGWDMVCGVCSAVVTRTRRLDTLR